MRDRFLGVLTSLVLLGSGGAANAVTTDLTVGDSLTLKYYFPTFGTVIESQTFTYTGPGQTVPFQFGVSTLDILSNSEIAFQENALCGVCFQTSDPWNGPDLFDTTNTNAFSDWGILSDTVGITSSIIAPGEIGVNWQGAQDQGEVLAGVTSSTPIPSTWTMLIAGFVGLGFFAYRGSRKNAALAAA